MNYKLLLQYDGTKYDGWQKQKTTSSTIQGKLELILSRMAAAPIEVHGSGRTDAGVHAAGQVANFKCDIKFEPEYILAYINQYLPQDICVSSVSIVNERFHSRLNAQSKTYLYRIHNSTVKNIFQRNYVTHIERPLNLELMQEAADYFLGEHDFKSFCSKTKMKKSAVRTIYRLDISQTENEIRILVHGSGFLYHMVRIIAGTLIEVGLREKQPEDIKTIIRGKDRELAGYTAPAAGLTLLKVFYD